MKSSTIFTAVKKMLIIDAIISDDNDDDSEKKGWVASGRQWFGVTYDLRGRLYINTVGDVTAFL